MSAARIAVTSRAFSRSQPLVESLVRAGFCDVRLHEGEKSLEGDDLAAFLQDRDAAILGMDRVDDQLLSACGDLKLLSKFGVGLDNVDREACEARGVRVAWTPGVNRRSVAEQVLGYMLALLRNIYSTSNDLKQGVWNKSGGVQLSGRVIGIIGLGNIGSELVRLLEPFDCHVLGNDIADRSALAAERGVELVSKETLARESDIVTLHTPLTAETRSLVGRDMLARMKPSAFLINTARGEIVDLEALENALRTGSIAGAALDVYDVEPPGRRSLLEMENVICTPHTGGNAREAVLAMGYAAIDQLVEYFGKER